MQLSITPNPRLIPQIIHQDPHFIAALKPPGVPTQPGVGHDRDSLMNGLFAALGPQLQGLGQRRDFGLLHRLDRPTSGLVLVALTHEGYDGLRALFKARAIEKTYLALAHGGPKAPKGRISKPIAQVRRGGRKLAQLGGAGAQAAATRYEVLSRAQGLALLACEIETGRLHQIRVHLAALGCPVLGDREYGLRSPLDLEFARASKRAIFLHAAALRFTHPVTGASVALSAPLPAAHLAFLEARRLSLPRRWR
ncbi:RluA family pseudouridine synthase [Myxococcota bacterium]|nr:RluA family pseudouridine synthase [Myxococcota bacterium]MBU1898611.1 RluA family pseudouridine synthase [Myxococcota bacterium]